MKIEDIKVKRILDSRGEETIEIEISSEGIKERTSVPIGKSLGKHEAICLDCEKIEKNLTEFLENIKNLDFKDSKDFDNFLIKRAGKDKEKLGANFTLGASIAFARILAKKKGLELWEYLEKDYSQNNLPGYKPDILPGYLPDNLPIYKPYDDQEERKLIFSDLTSKLLKIFFEIHNKLGPSFKEEHYKNAIRDFLRREGISFETEKYISVNFRNFDISNLRVDFIVENKIILEIKAKSFITKEDIRQTLRYLKVLKLPLAIIVNFRKKRLEYKRIINPDVIDAFYLSTLDPSGNHPGNSSGNHPVNVPGLIINIIGGGVHSFNNLDFQEYWLIADLLGLTRIDINNTDKRGYNADKRGYTADEREYFDTRINADFNTDLCGYFDEILAKILNIINKLEEKLPKPLGRNDEGAFCTNFSDNYEPFVYLKEVINDLPGYKPDKIHGLKPDKSGNHPGNKSGQNPGDISGNNPGILFERHPGNITFELGADIAANQIAKLVNWKRIYEKLKLLDVKYLEDPFKEDDFENFANLRKQGFKVIGDDLTVTNVERLKIALEKNSVDGVIVKPNQVGTILETFEFVKLAKENNLFTIFSHRSGETNDHWLIDLGIAFKADFFKIGPPLQGERVAKYNRLREILEKF
jgi:GxxExxY protein